MSFYLNRREEKRRKAAVLWRNVEEYAWIWMGECLVFLSWSVRESRHSYSSVCASRERRGVGFGNVICACSSNWIGGVFKRKAASRGSMEME